MPCRPRRRVARISWRLSTAQVGQRWLFLPRPTLFLAFASDDLVLSLVWEGSLRLCVAWKAAGHRIEMNIYSKGGHGFGMAQQGWPSDHWIERLSDWLQIEGFLA